MLVPKGFFATKVYKNALAVGPLPQTHLERSWPFVSS